MKRFTMRAIAVTTVLGLCCLGAFFNMLAKSDSSGVEASQLHGERILAPPVGAELVGSEETCEDISGFQQYSVIRRYSSILSRSELAQFYKEHSTSDGWHLAYEETNVQAAPNMRRISFDKIVGNGVTANAELTLPSLETSSQSAVPAEYQLVLRVLTNGNSC